MQFLINPTNRYFLNSMTRPITWTNANTTTILAYWIFYYSTISTTLCYWFQQPI